jgi:hypothetical protein
MKIHLRKYRGFKLRLVDTEDSYWVGYEKGDQQDCTERYNDETSAIDAAKAEIDKLLVDKNKK